jgi:hypothetical protein
MSKILNIHIPAEQKNLTINGAYDFWQELGGGVRTFNTATTIGSTQSYYSDMAAVAAAGSNVKNFSLQRSTDVPTASQSGYVPTYSALFTMITGISTLAATDYVYPHLYKMEGFEYQKVHNRVVTFGFWVKASVAGTYSFAMSNGVFTRSYVTTFPINSANTWEFKSITVTLDSVNSSFTFDSSSGLTYSIGTIAGSSYQTSTLNTWQSGYFIAATTGTNWIATNGATLRHTMVSMVEGSLGFGATGFQRAGKSFQQELSMCQRYFEKSYSFSVVAGTSTDNGRFAVVQTSGNRPYLTIPFKVEKRVIPTIIIYNTATGAINTLRTETGLDVGVGIDVVTLGTTALNLYQAAGANSNTAGAYGHYTADSRL